jgi:geranyl-CoA carboxylase alpha subunit
LPLSQDEIAFTGHAIEARLYAEDPYDGWKPQTGRITGWVPERAGIRVDHGMQAGGEVTPYYDAMVAKFVAHGSDRADALRRLTRALEDTPLLGINNNGRFLRDLVRHSDFTTAVMTTTRLDEWLAAGEPLLQRPVPPEAAWSLASALLAHAGGLRPTSVSHFDITLQCQGQTRKLRAPPEGLDVHSVDDGVVHYSTGGVQRRAQAVVAGGTVQVTLDGAIFTFTEPSPFPAVEADTDPGRARAPVAGVVAQVAVAVGDVVVAGQPLVCVEAMKMEMWLNAAAAGTVRALNVKSKDPVAAGAVLVELDIAP